MSIPAWQPRLLVARGTPVGRNVPMLLDALLQSPYEYGILCESDAVFKPDFKLQLALTLQDIRDDSWRVLHLCPGCLWGRELGVKDFALHLEPAVKPEWFTFTPHKRAAQLHVHNCWLGGPLAMLVKRSHARQLRAEYLAMYNAERDSPPLDVILTDVARAHAHDYVAYDPPLCVERDAHWSVREQFIRIGQREKA